MTTECVNLQERFGQRYRIRFEEGFTGREADAAWGMEIKCRFGIIAPYGGQTLQVMVDGHRTIAGQLKRLDCCRLIQDGQNETTFLFDVAHFDTVSAIVLPYRKPQLTEQQRQVMADRLKRYAFQPHNPAMTPGQIASNSRPGEKSDPKCVPAVPRPATEAIR